MTICLAHMTALRYWRAVRCGLVPAPRAARSMLPEKTNRSEISTLRGIPWVQSISGDSIHIAVSQRSGVRNIPGAVCHCLLGSPAAKRLMRADCGVLVMSPEAMFLHLAGTLSFEALALLAFELCGEYSRMPDGSGFMSAKPVSSVASLTAFASSAASFPGNARARKALRFALDNSASPAESRLVLLLCAKRTLGGYGLPLPKMNHRANVVGEGRKCTAHKYFVFDLFWENARLDVEYDSDMFHASAEGISSDAERRNALLAMGYRVITVTNAQISSPDMFDDVVRAIAHALNFRVRHSGALWPEKRSALRCGLRAAQRLV